MAEPLQVQQDMTPVTITLDRKRPYHIGDDERKVVWVGPGVVDVPRWVADHWGAVAVETTTGAQESLPPKADLPPAPAVPKRTPRGRAAKTPRGGA